MKNTYKDYLNSSFPVLKPSPELFERITARIEHSKKIRARLFLIMHGILTAGSLLALVFVAEYGHAQALNSGLYDYLSLILSDNAYLVANWKSGILSIIESIPLMWSILTVGTLLIAVNSFKRGMQQVKLSHLFIQI